MKNWLEHSPSFMHFYKEVRAMAANRGCQVPDELAGTKSKRRAKS